MGLATAAEVLDEEAAEVGVRVGGGGCADWWLGAIDLLVRTSPSQGANVADHIKEQLMERDRYQSWLPYRALSFVTACHLLLNVFSYVISTKIVIVTASIAMTLELCTLTLS